MGDAAAAAPFNAIDVHCHVFNAKDIPIRKFVEDIYLDPTVVLSVLDPVVALLSYIMDGEAPTAAAELAALASQKRVTPSRLSDLVAVALRQMQSSTSKFDPPGSDAAAAQQARKDWMTQRANAAGVNVAVGRMAAYHAGGLADAVMRDDTLKNWIDWAWLYTKARYDIADELAALPKTGAHEIKLFCPAIIDYAYWLGETDTTAIADQVSVMDAITRRVNGNYGIHSWVAFCPGARSSNPPRPGNRRSKSSNRPSMIPAASG